MFPTKAVYTGIRRYPVFSFMHVFSSRFEDDLVSREIRFDTIQGSWFVAVYAMSHLLKVSRNHVTYANPPLNGLTSIRYGGRSN